MEEWRIVKYKIPKEVVWFMDTVFELMEIRGRVGKQDGVEFIIHSNETNHTVPHIHAKYGEFEISVTIKDGTVLTGNLPKKQTNTAIKWVLNHREELLTKWNGLAISAISNMTTSRIGTELSDEFKEA